VKFHPKRQKKEADHGPQAGNFKLGEERLVPVMYVAFELANSTWKLACSDGNKLRHITVTAGDLSQVQGAILGAKRHFGMGDKVRTVSCYEAGRDGFWLHRYLYNWGIANVVVDSASLEVDRRLRRTKTDRIDAGKLLRMLVRYHGGEKRLWRIVRVPNREDEDARYLHLELEALKGANQVPQPDPWNSDPTRAAHQQPEQEKVCPGVGSLADLGRPRVAC
jgi:hypothetical protein